MVQQVLLDNAANYAKPDIVKRLLGPTIGSGLLTADGELWREQRRIVAASFSPAAVDAQRTTFVEAARASDGRRGATASGATWPPRRPGRPCRYRLALFGGDQRLISDDVDGATSPPRSRASPKPGCWRCSACRTSR